MENKSFSTVGIIIILVILIAGGYFSWQYFGIPKEEIKDETADWKTYKNEEYGFEIKYPKNFAVETENSIFPSNYYCLSKDSCTASAERAYSVFHISFNGIKVVVFNNPAQLATKEWVQKYESLKEVQSSEEIMIGEEKAQRLIFTDGVIVNISYIAKGSLVYSIRASYSESAGELVKTLDQILSTFRFLETEIAEEINKNDCSIQDLSPQNKCYYLAIKNKDDTYCKGIPSGEVQINCYAGVSMLKNAINNNNPSLCWVTTIPFLASSCWEDFGMKDWKTYENEILKFVIEKIKFFTKYPDNWDHTVIGEYSPQVFFGLQDMIENLESGKSVDDKSLGIIISAYDKILYERSILPYRKSNEYLLITSSNIVLDGIQGVNYISEYLVSKAGYQKGDKTITVDLKFSDGYLSVYLFNYQNLDIFQKILSTFWFLE